MDAALAAHIGAVFLRYAVESRAAQRPISNSLFSQPRSIFRGRSSDGASSSESAVRESHTFDGEKGGGVARRCGSMAKMPHHQRMTGGEEKGERSRESSKKSQRRGRGHYRSTYEDGKRQEHAKPKLAR